MKASPHPVSTTFYRSPAVLGTLWGILSALTYAATNILLRQLSEDNDPVWVTCMKALPTLVVAGLLWLVMWIRQRRIVAPPWQVVVFVVLSALAVQVCGNLLFQWTLSVIGLALTVPISFGTLIASSAILGRIWLGEPITSRGVVSMALLMGSIGVLALGAGETRQALPQRGAGGETTSLVALGVAASCLAGVGYGLAAVVIRAATRQMSVVSTLGFISGTGVLVLGAASLCRIGPRGILATGSVDFTFMLLAGSFNAIGFYSLAKSLKYISVVHANVINASQAAIAAVTGVLIFHEPSSWPLAVGVPLTILGLLVMRREPQTGDEHH